MNLTSEKTATVSVLEILEREDKPPKPFASIGKHISHSQVSLFDRCELAWWFKYIKGITKPPTIHMLLGQCYHKALAHNFFQKCHTGVDIPLDQVLRKYNSEYQQSIRSGDIDAPTSVDLEEYRLPVERLLAHYYTEYVVGKMEPLLVEQEFTCNVPGIDRKFAGIIDVQLSDGTMIDFKVTSRKWSPTDISENTQSTAYAMLYGYDTDFEFHVGLRANKNPAIQIVKLQRTNDDVNKYITHLQTVVSRMKALETGQDDPVPQKGYCNEKMCQYYWECNRWKYGDYQDYGGDV